MSRLDSLGRCLSMAGRTSLAAWLVALVFALPHSGMAESRITASDITGLRSDEGDVLLLNSPRSSPGRRTVYWRTMTSVASRIRFRPLRLRYR